MSTGLKGKVIYEGAPEFSKGPDIGPANKTSIGPTVNFSWTPSPDHKASPVGKTAAAEHDARGAVGPCQEGQPLATKKGGRPVDQGIREEVRAATPPLHLWASTAVSNPLPPQLHSKE
jgi:hypothetical protein